MAKAEEQNMAVQLEGEISNIRDDENEEQRDEENNENEEHNDIGEEAIEDRPDNNISFWIKYLEEQCKVFRWSNIRKFIFGERMIEGPSLDTGVSDILPISNIFGQFSEFFRLKKRSRHNSNRVTKHKFNRNKHHARTVASKL